MWHLTPDTWHLTYDTWHVTPDMWNVTPDMWHMTCDTWHDTWHVTHGTMVEGEHSLKISAPQLLRFGQESSWLAESIYDGVCKTAPATPGLLII